MALGPLKPYLRGVPPGLPFKWDVATLAAGLNFPLETSEGALDVLEEITGGGSYENLLGHSAKVQLFGMECLCISSSISFL